MCLAHFKKADEKPKKSKAKSGYCSNYFKENKNLDVCSHIQFRVSSKIFSYSLN